MERRRGLTIVVGGYIVGLPYGGMTWHHLNYLLGLHELGHEVYFLEDSGSFCLPYNPDKLYCETDSTYGREYLKRTFVEYGLPLRYCYYSESEDRHYGMSKEDLHDVLSRADLLLCISGITPIREDRPRPRRTAVIDTDPVYTQICMTKDPGQIAYYKWFDRVATFGTLMGQHGCTIPTHDLKWVPINQPVALQHWPVTASVSKRFTTIGRWDHDDRDLRFGGKAYRSSKGVEWMKMMDLPSRVPWEMEMCIQLFPAEPARQLREAKWLLGNAEKISRSCRCYQQYIAGAAGEFTVCKHIYTAMPSGWFSDRSAAFLASGRPVVTQATGFNTWLPTGEGLFSFKTLDEAAGALNMVHADYPRHCAAARRLAEEFFDSRRVLPVLLEQLL